MEEMLDTFDINGKFLTFFQYFFFFFLFFFTQIYI